MIDLACPMAKLSPDPSAEDGLHVPVPGTPPRSPVRPGQHGRPSTGKEEDAAESLMKLATPVKSPCPPSASPRGAGANGTHTCSEEMTPVSLFRKSRQSPGPFEQMQSPFQSPMHPFQLSPGCLISPPNAGTLDFPLPGADDTPSGDGAGGKLWAQSTPERPTPDVHDGGSGEDGVRAEDNRRCGKRTGKALFTDKRGPQDHSRGLGATWCLGTPGRGRHGMHLEVTDAPATPDRTSASGGQVLPPTPKLLPPTPPPTRVSQGSGAGEGAVGILMGLRSPVSSPFDTDAAHSLFAALEDEGYEACSPVGGVQLNRRDARRPWSSDRGDRAAVNVQGRTGGGPAPHSAPSKRMKRWGGTAVTPRNAHCKGSFKIEGMTLIRTGSSSSVGSGSGSSGGRGGSGRARAPHYRSGISAEELYAVESKDAKMSPAAAAPLSPAKSSSSAPESPPKAAVTRRPTPSSAPPRPSARSARAERSRRGAASDAPNGTGAAVSDASLSSSRPGSRNSASSEASPPKPAVKIEPPNESFRTPETTPSLRRRASVQPPSSHEGPSALPNPDQAISLEEELRPTTCNCKKSKCLKLYCECFQRRQYCSDCNCVECHNTEQTEQIRQEAIQNTLERNPAAFVSKFEKRAGKRSHNAGCNCKKSACLKKYCECFQAGVACGTNCKCSNCKNYEGAMGGRRRRSSETATAQPLSTPPRTSGRRAGAAAAAAAADADTKAAATKLTKVKAVSSPDHHVQVGGGDEDSPPPRLADALRAGRPPSFGEDDGTGYRELSAMATSVGAGASPPALAVADHAVAKSLLDMGETPSRVQEEPKDRGFELSMAATSGDPTDRNGFARNGVEMTGNSNHGEVSGGSAVWASRPGKGGDTGTCNKDLDADVVDIGSADMPVDAAVDSVAPFTPPPTWKGVLPGFGGAAKANGSANGRRIRAANAEMSPSNGRRSSDRGTCAVESGTTGISV